MIQNAAQFTTILQTNAGQYQFIAQWAGLNRVLSGWHPTPGAAWNALSIKLAPHLARATARQLPTS